MSNEATARRELTATVIAVAAAAWLVLAWWHTIAPHHGVPAAAPPPIRPAGSHDHAHHGSPAGPLPLPSPGLVLWYAGWLVMVVAMMLPPALPLLRISAQMFGRSGRRRLLITAVAAGFVAVWAVAGMILVAAGWALSVAARGWGWLMLHPQVPAGLAAVAAGAYQFTGWKRACLTACRSPRSIAMTTWSGRRTQAVEATLIGLRFGAVCVGCCWALMVLTLAVGAAAVAVMVVAAAAMAAERLLPRVRAVVPVIAAAAVVTGVLILVRVVPAGLTVG